MMVIGMSHGELSRGDTLLRVERGELRVEDASTLLGLCRRQIFRLLSRLHATGPEGLISAMGLLSEEYRAAKITRHPKLGSIAPVVCISTEDLETGRIGAILARRLAD